jgi:hypothetical protein
MIPDCANENTGSSFIEPQLICALLADDAQRDLDAALPALDAAVASLKNLQRNDIVEVKSLQNPPAGVKLVMEVTCIMFDEKPKMKDDPNKMGKSHSIIRSPHLASLHMTIASQVVQDGVGLAGTAVFL